ncbi:hypothetical protein ACP4OV_005406 [Aristida adscensionis]
MSTQLQHEQVALVFRSSQDHDQQFAYINSSPDHQSIPSHDSHPMEAEAVDPHPSEVVVDRLVRFIDEVAEEIERAGAPALDDTMGKVLADVEARRGISCAERRSARQAALRAELLRYRVEVEEPAAAALRDRRAFSPSPVGRDTAVPFTGGVPGCLHREVLRGVEPVVEVAAPPALTSLVLRVSWPRDFPLRHYPAATCSPSTSAATAPAPASTTRGVTFFLADRPRFRFAALPEECFVRDGHMGRMRPQLSRSACCVERGDGRWTLELLAMDSHGRGHDCALEDQTCRDCRRQDRRDCPRQGHPQDCPLHCWTLTTWTMALHESSEHEQQLEWEKGSSVCLAEVIKDPDLQAMQPQVPVLSMAEEGVVYLVLSDLFKSRDYCLFKIDLKLQRVLYRTERLPSGEDTYFLHPFVLGSQFNTYLNKRNKWSEAQQKRDAAIPTYEKLSWTSAGCCGQPPPGSNNMLGLTCLLDA